jgi:hypothetical protein
MLLVLPPLVFSLSKARPPFSARMAQSIRNGASNLAVVSIAPSVTRSLIAMLLAITIESERPLQNCKLVKRARCNTIEVISLLALSLRIARARRCFSSIYFQEGT